MRLLALFQAKATLSLERESCSEAKKKATGKGVGRAGVSAIWPNRSLLYAYEGFGASIFLSCGHGT